jgi:CRISPR-associated protein Csb2
MLAMQVQFLCDLDSLAAHDLLDWPPQRCQLLCALADAAQQHRLGSSARAALLWLEHQFPPATHAVPTATELGTRRLTVTYVWHDAQPDATLRRVLHNVAQAVTHLGTDRTPVRVSLCDRRLGPFAPADDRPQPPRRLRRFRRPTPRADFRDPRPSAVRSGPFGEMIVFRLPDDVCLDVTDTLDVASRLRATFLKQCGHPTRVVPEILSGHDEANAPSRRPHAAYVALPDLRHDGRIAGLAVVLPADLDEHERRLVHRVAGSVRRLWMPGGEELPLELREGDDREPGLRPQTWSAAARRWASVTPVVLDRFPRRDGRDLGETIRASCRNLGLPEAVEVVAGQGCAVDGAPPSDAFRIRRLEDWQHHTLPEVKGPPRPSRHVSLVFAEPVRGPLLLGHSRYFGLGLLRPLSSESGSVG